MFVHSLTHVRTARDMGTLDEYGQPTEGATTETTVMGLVQPQMAREADDSRSAGFETADHVIFLPLMDVHPSDAFLYGGDRYAIQGVREFRFGSLAHLEVDARRIVGDTVGGGVEAS